jgi:hypothetical protein
MVHAGSRYLCYVYSVLGHVLTVVKAQGNKRAMNRLTEMKRFGAKRVNMTRPTRQDAKDECVIC